MLERQLRLRNMLEREEEQYAAELDRMADSEASDRVSQMRERARALRENREVSPFISTSQPPFYSHSLNKCLKQTIGSAGRAHPGEIRSTDSGGVGGATPKNHREAHARRGARAVGAGAREGGAAQRGGRETHVGRALGSGPPGAHEARGARGARGARVRHEDAREDQRGPRPPGRRRAAAKGSFLFFLISLIIF